MQSEAMGGSNDQRPVVTSSEGELTLQLGEVEEFESFAVLHDEPGFYIVYDDGQFIGELVTGKGISMEMVREVGERYGLILDGLGIPAEPGYMGLRFREIGGYAI